MLAVVRVLNIPVTSAPFAQVTSAHDRLVTTAPTTVRLVLCRDSTRHWLEVEPLGAHTVLCTHCHASMKLDICWSSTISSGFNWVALMVMTIALVCIFPRTAISLMRKTFSS